MSKRVRDVCATYREVNPKGENRMVMFEVRSKLRETNVQARDNGSLGPFKTREAAERCLIAMCQAGQANQGEIVPVNVADDPEQPAAPRS